MSKRSEKRLHRELRDERDARLPARGEKLPVVEMRSRRGGRHPWVYRRMLQERHDLPPGSLVELVSRDGHRVGCGFYNANSEIGVRLLTEDPRVTPDAAWFAERLGAAVAFRHAVLRLPEKTDAYRVVHSDGDGLSGLVVDRLGEALVVELFSAGMFRHLAWLKDSLRAHFPEARLVVRVDRRSAKLEGMPIELDADEDAPRKLIVREGPARFHVDLRRGHKTGFFADQREHRARLAELCRGAELFDGCCYSGGFAVQAALAGAKQVEAVDLDENAVAVAEENLKLNGVEGKVRARHANVFDVLRDHRAARRKFARVVLDPPKLAVTREERPKALEAYQDMNRLGMQCLEDGGVLVSCSCTGLVGEEDLLGVLREAAAEANKDLQVFHVGGASPDHPWSIHMPEGRYLKVVFSRVRPRA